MDHLPDIEDILSDEAAIPPALSEITMARIQKIGAGILDEPIPIRLLEIARRVGKQSIH